MTPSFTPPYPGHILAAGVQQSGFVASILAVQKRLNQVGCGPVPEDAKFSSETVEAVERFQSRSEDAFRQPLTVDGQVGPMTWATLFGTALPLQQHASSALLTAVLDIARLQIGILEQPLGSNSGPEVDQYLHSVHAAPGAPWCAAFVYWCFQHAATSLSITNPAICTAGAVDLWYQAGSAGALRIAATDAAQSPALVNPGMVFVLSTGGGHGHTGLVESVSGVVLTTIEGNTNQGGSPEGIGVFRRTGRRVSQINEGFVDYSRRA